eukprot:265542-Chlamydomonas_euryale.AAC.3
MYAGGRGCALGTGHLGGRSLPVLLAPVSAVSADAFISSGPECVPVSPLLLAFSWPFAPRLPLSPLAFSRLFPPRLPLSPLAFSR